MQREDHFQVPLDLHQPLANKTSKGQLAAILRSRRDLEFDGFGLGKDISRSSSAPPTQAFMGSRFENDEGASPSDPRLDPEYAAYYYVHSRLDPRLPPPLYTPGQSGQLWNGFGKSLDVAEKPLERFKGFAGNDLLNSSLDQPLEPEGKRTDDFERDSGTGSEYSPNTKMGRLSSVADLKAPRPQKGHFVVDDDNSPKKRNLVDIIQDDFPRTPSPVYAMRQRQENLEKAARTFDEFGMIDGRPQDTNEVRDDDHHVRSILNVALEGHSKDDSRLPFNRAKLSPPPRSSSTPPTQFNHNFIRGDLASEEMLLNLRKMNLMDRHYPENFDVRHERLAREGLKAPHMYGQYASESSSQLHYARGSKDVYGNFF